MLKRSPAAENLQKRFEEQQKEVEIRNLVKKVNRFSAVCINLGIALRVRVDSNTAGLVSVVIDLKHPSYYPDLSRLLERKNCSHRNEKSQLIYSIPLALNTDTLSLRNNFFHNHSVEEIDMLLEQPVISDFFIQKWRSIPENKGKMTEKELYGHLVNVVNAEDVRTYKQVKELIERKLHPSSRQHSLSYLGGIGVVARPSVKNTILPVENCVPFSYKT